MIPWMIFLAKGLLVKQPSKIIAFDEQIGRDDTGTVIDKPFVVGTINNKESNTTILSIRMMKRC